MKEIQKFNEGDIVFNPFKPKRPGKVKKIIPIKFQIENTEIET